MKSALHLSSPGLMSGIMQADPKTFLGTLSPFLAAGITAVATLLGTLIAVMFAWLKERTQSAKRSQLIKEATDRVLFWKVWQELRVANGTSDELDDIRKKIQEELDSVGLNFQRRICIPPRPDSLIRRLLLLYKPRNDVVWCFRILFYSFLVLAIPFGLWTAGFVGQFQLEAIERFGPNLLIAGAPKSPEHITFEYVRNYLDPNVARTLALVVVGLEFQWLWCMMLFAFVALFMRWVSLDLDRDRLPGETLLAAFGKWIADQKKAIQSGKVNRDD